MALTTGTRIGNYEVIEPLGAGGMGEVYRARDTRLGRTAAIKALPESLAHEADRRARFEREAQLLASLNHPNIAGIYGIEDAGGGSYLALELVEGESLAQRLARGPLPVRETLEVGGQIAAAIEAAHEGGIVHRDLKPGNVMLTPSGAVKVLDFGLAKGGAPQGSSALDLSSSPTAVQAETGEGVILGTASYMSPEQARGRAVDRRADVWAFGCVLYECLAGHQAFGGATASDVIARIIEREPDWSILPGGTPQRLRDLVRRCLTKDAEERPRDIGDLRRELNAIRLDLSGSHSAAPASPDVPSLAVLYFENLAKDSESEYFCSGITEDILTDLSKIKGLRVASRNAVARYRGTPVDPARVRADLGVGAVVEGSVRRAGDRVRITVQLVNAADGFQLWAERYDRTLEDVFAVQEEIASSIAAALRVALSPGEARQLVQDRPKDVRAYDLYLKGRERYRTYSPEGFREALALFEQAIAVDPQYALAWAGIADCCGQTLQWELTEDTEGVATRGLEAARRAITLNPKLAEGYKSEGLVLRYAGDPAAARRSLIKATEANPNYTPTLITLAVHEFGAGNVAATERLIRRAMELDPQEPFAHGWLAWLLSMTGRMEEAVTVSDRARLLSDEEFYVTGVHLTRATAALLRGDLEGARQAVRDALADGADRVAMQVVEASVALKEERFEDARTFLKAWDRGAWPSGGGEFIVGAACVAVRVEEHDRAVRFLMQRSFRDFAPIVVRLTSELHPLLDREPFAPRRAEMTLVWPIEAPMMSPAVHALFNEVRIEAGTPKGSDLGLK